ncbi:bombesin receptor subtype-3-like [Ptychodera flava]|uniref:bombesin receptor subtype-3-like n=1 Tax=Ptychodera flava TaxID=63121 RepID=UPI00396A07C2
MSYFLFDTDNCSTCRRNPNSELEFSFNWTLGGPPKCYMEDSKLMAIVTTLAVIGFLGNALFIFVVVREKSMRTLPNYFVINLACADLLCLCGFMLFPLLRDVGAVNIAMVVYLRVFIMDVATFSSIFTVVLVTVDRYTAICHPFRAAQMQGRRRTCTLIVSSWSLGVCLALAEFLVAVVPSIRNLKSQKIVLFLFMIFTVIPLLLVSVLYVLICRQLLRSDMTLERTRSRAKWRREKQVLVVCTFVLIVFILCMLPQICMLIYSPFVLISSLNISPELSMCISFISPLMMIVNFVVNPFVYNLPSKSQRRAFVQAFRREKRQQNMNFSRNYSLTSV